MLLLEGVKELNRLAKVFYQEDLKMVMAAERKKSAREKFEKICKQCKTVKDAYYNQFK